MNIGTQKIEINNWIKALPIFFSLFIASTYALEKGNIMENKMQESYVKQLYQHDKRLQALDSDTGFWKKFNNETIDKILISPPQFPLSFQDEHSQNFNVKEMRKDSYNKGVSILLQISSDTEKEKLFSEISFYLEKDHNFSESYFLARSAFLTQFTNISAPFIPYSKYKSFGTISVKDTTNIEPKGKIIWVYKNIMVIIHNDGFTEENVIRICDWLQKQLESHVKNEFIDE